MLLLLILFASGLLPRMTSAPYLSWPLLPCCFSIPGTASVANDDNAGNELFLRPWTKNITIRNTASWSTEASVYAAWRSSSLHECHLSSEYSHFFSQAFIFSPVKHAYVHCFIQLSNYTDTFLYFLAASQPPEPSVASTTIRRRRAWSEIPHREALSVGLRCFLAMLQPP